MPQDPTRALATLKDGNLRFVGDRRLHRFASEERATNLARTPPIAVVVGCSDARVPIEVVFDAGVGELFVVRTAGHVLAAASLASVRFAVEKLGCSLIVVLGHEDCGAVSAALSGDAPAWLAPIVARIDTSAAQSGWDPGGADGYMATANDPLLAAAVDRHVHATSEALRTYLADFAPDAVVAGGAYELSSGKVHWLDS